MLLRPRDIEHSSFSQIVSFIASLVTVVSIAVSAFFYLKDRPARARDTVYAAWQIVANMEGKKGSGGREAAIAQLRDHDEDLTGIALDSGFLNGVDLSHADLLKSSFIYSSLSNSTFNHSRLSFASFRGARLHKAQFINTSLDSVDFYAATITDANFNQGEMVRCVGDSITTFNGSTFNKVKITYSEFQNANFDNTLFENSHFVEVVLTGSRMRRSRLNDSVWRHVEAPSVDLLLSEATNIYIGAWSNLRGSRFDRAILHSAKFEQAILSKASFFNSDLSKAEFVDSDLSFADFSSSILKNVEITRCNIESTLFSGADQTGLTVMGCYGKPIDLRVGYELK